MTEDRLPWFPCYQSKLLGALAGMPPDSGYVYMIVILRCYEVEGVCPDTAEVLARRTGMTKARVAKAIEWLLEHGKLIRCDGGLENTFATEVLNERNQKHNRLSSAGKLGAEKKHQKDKQNQRKTRGQAKDMPKPPHGILDLDTELDKDSKKDTPLPPRGNVLVDDWPPDHLEQFWIAFPPHRRQAKRLVGEKLKKLQKRGLSWETIITGVRAYAASDPAEYAKAPLAWLNGEMWDREYSARSGGSNASNRNGGSKVGFSGLAAKLRQDIREAELSDRGYAPEDLEPINRR